MAEVPSVSHRTPGPRHGAGMPRSCPTTAVALGPGPSVQTTTSACSGDLAARSAPPEPAPHTPVQRQPTSLATIPRLEMGMSESRDGRGSSPAEGVADWVVLHGGAMAVVRVPSVVVRCCLPPPGPTPSGPTWPQLAPYAGRRVVGGRPRRSRTWRRGRHARGEPRRLTLAATGADDGRWSRPGHGGPGSSTDARPGRWRCG